MVVHSRDAPLANGAVVTLRHLDGHALLALLRQQSFDQLQLLGRYLLHVSVIRCQCRAARRFCQGRLLRYRGLPRVSSGRFLVLRASVSVNDRSIRVLDTPRVPVVEAVNFTEDGLIRIEGDDSLVELASDSFGLDRREAVVGPVDGFIVFAPVELVVEQLVEIWKI